MFEKLKDFTKRVKREAVVWKLVMKDQRTPLAAKILLGIALVYTVFPIDLIPDFIPVIGYLDDILLVAVMVWVAVKIIPKEVIEDCRHRSQSPP